MKQQRLRYVDSNMRRAQVGGMGISSADWKKMQSRLVRANDALRQIDLHESQGFLRLPFDASAQKATASLARHVTKRFKNLVVLGIGGSDLGARAIQQALVHPISKQKGMSVHFAGATTDSDDITRILSTVDLRETCINIISKSGDTIEPMAVFHVLTDRLKRAVGKSRYAEHIVATTDPTTGSLRAMSEKEGFATLLIPQNVGGRFSVLSSVGLFPAAVMGVDTSQLLAGAAAAVSAFQDCKKAECAACRFAGLHTWSAEQGRATHVTMAYSTSLTEFNRWTRQLVAESLGKKNNRQGKAVHAGITPIACTGPEDQHSQLQLWMEGPQDKVITFIEIEKRLQDVKTPFGSLNTLIQRECWATGEALRREGRPSDVITLERLDAFALGELLMFFEIAVALMGELMNVNAFDQPGVVLMKRLLLEKSGSL